MTKKVQRNRIDDPAAVAQLRLATALLQNADDLKPALLAAIRAGCPIPDDLEGRTWVADVLEGKLSKRGRGRPAPKKLGGWTPALLAQRDRAMPRRRTRNTTAGAPQRRGRPRRCQRRRPPVATFFALALDSGARKSELLGRAWDSVDFDAGHRRRARRCRARRHVGAPMVNGTAFTTTPNAQHYPKPADRKLLHAFSPHIIVPSLSGSSDCSLFEGGWQWQAISIRGTWIRANEMTEFVTATSSASFSTGV